ncbi:MAG: zinc ABC transporter substrate-binding protein [Lachnospiraceae bacterium]|nr:zinc ABC transporter substrate-binding protein [Lachnospiraceae bacterium]
MIENRLKKGRLTALLLALAVSLSLLAGCGGGGTHDGSSGGAADDGKIQIVTTIFPAYDFARQVAGVRAEVTMLLSPGEELHSYEPSPKDMIAIEECDIFIYVGGESDTWMKDVLEAVNVEGKTVISMMEETEVLTEEITEGMVHTHWNGLWDWILNLLGSGHNHEDSDHDGKHAHGEGEVCDDPDHLHEAEYDEHVWTSPANAGLIVSAITEALCQLDTEGEAYYRERESAYLGELDELKAEMLAIRQRAKRTTIIVGDRFPFRYLAEFMDLEYFAAFPGCAEETEPSAKTVAFLIDKIREEEIPAVFYQEFSSHMMAQTIAEDTGAKALLLHSCHNVTKDEFEAGLTYLDIMRQNMVNLEWALCE